jgi:hypothetical protein
MTEAWAAPAFQISMSADMTARRSCARRSSSASGRAPDRDRRADEGLRVALMRHREVNALFAGDAIELHPVGERRDRRRDRPRLARPGDPGCER